MSLRWYAFLCGFGSDVLFTINHLRSISFFCQKAHHDWLIKEYISNWFLVYKLEYYGFRGIVLDWFKSYLKNRKQFVRYQACDSEYKNIKCGVPQGSVLGPLLFILYVNYITSATSLFEIILFADDTTLLYSHPDIATKINLINKELSEICNWFKANKLSVNASKTNYMILGTSHTTNKIYLWKCRF